MDFGIIDCDFHPSLPAGADAIFPYLTRGQRERLEWLGISGSMPQINFRMPGRAQHFTNPIREDCVAPTGGAPASNLDFVRSHYLDPHQIAASVLIPLQPAQVDFWTYPDEAAWFVSAFNDYFLDHWLANEPRFNLDMVVSPHDPALAVKEIERIGGRPGVAAVFLPMTDRLFGHRSWFPIYEAAQEQGLPIMVHVMSSNDFFGTGTSAGGTPNHYAERYATLNQPAMTNISSLVFEGVFERYPELKFIFVEFGWSWLSALLWRMDATWKAARRHHPWMRKSPTEYVLSNIRLTSEPMLECPQRWLDDAIAMAHGSQTMLYSSDYPHWDSEEPLVAFKGIDDDVRRRIYRENALEVFGERLRVVDPVLAAA
jgi:predicted TIM-barrel fold metal-dependent hydrolase